MQHPNQRRHSYRPDVQAACRRRNFLFLSPFLASAPCHACLQMAVHERQESDGKKARKTATSSGFRDLRWAPPGCFVAEKLRTWDSLLLWFCVSGLPRSQICDKYLLGDGTATAQRRLRQAPAHGLSVPMQMRAILVRPRLLLITSQHAAASSSD